MSVSNPATHISQKRAVTFIWLQLGGLDLRVDALLQQ